jgi:hypothetical protein
VNTSLNDGATKRLYKHLVSNYEKLVRPVLNNKDCVKVAIGLKISRIIEMVLKDQVFCFDYI